MSDFGLILKIGEFEPEFLLFMSVSSFKKEWLFLRAVKISIIFFQISLQIALFHPSILDSSMFRINQMHKRKRFLLHLFAFLQIVFEFLECNSRAFRVGFVGSLDFLLLLAEARFNVRIVFSHYLLCSLLFRVYFATGAAQDSLRRLDCQKFIIFTPFLFVAQNDKGAL